MGPRLSIKLKVKRVKQRKQVLQPKCFRNIIAEHIKSVTTHLVTLHLAITRFAFSCLLSMRRKIFPLADFGIWSTNATPPLSFFCGCTFLATNSTISSAVTFPWRTTKAFGNSPASISGTPITATSSMFGWVINNASSSAGGTWK